MIWLSVPLGLLSWVVPIVFHKKKPAAVSAVSFGLCGLALLNVLWELYGRTVSGDYAALMDITDNLVWCSIALVVGTTVMNGLIYMKKIKVTSNTFVSILLLLLLISFLVWLLIPNHFLLLDSAEVQYEATSISEEQEAALIDLINHAGGKRKAFSEYTRFSLLDREFGGTSIHQGHAVFYLTTVYDGAFSLNPFHFGEDSTHQVLIKFNADGEAVAIWKMSYTFDELYSDWLDQFR